MIIECGKCRLQKDESEFYKSSVNNLATTIKYGKRPYCKPCSKEYCRRYKDDNSRRQKINIVIRKKRIFNHYCNGDPKCACCGEKIMQFLTIDHINNDGHIHRKKVGGGPQFYAWILRNNFPKDLQILCMNCNFGKRMNGGVCPHKGVAA